MTKCTSCGKDFTRTRPDHMYTCDDCLPKVVAWEKRSLAAKRAVITKRKKYKCWPSRNRQHIELSEYEIKLRDLLKCADQLLGTDLESNTRVNVENLKKKFQTELNNQFIPTIGQKVKIEFPNPQYDGQVGTVSKIIKMGGGAFDWCMLNEFPNIAFAFYQLSPI